MVEITIFAVNLEFMLKKMLFLWQSEHEEKWTSKRLSKVQM